MIPHYSDRAANERTFLAWVRTGIAIIALGFVIEKFYLVLSELAQAGSLPASVHARLPGPSWETSRFDGGALVVVGLAIIVISSLRFVRTSRMLSDDRIYTDEGTRLEVILSVVLAILVAAISAHLALG
jgi:putative membrane protein